MHTGQTIVATLCAVHCWHCHLRTSQRRLCVLGRSTCPCQRRAVLSRHDRGRLERSNCDGQCTFVTGSRREIHLRARTSHAHRPGMSLRSARRYRRLVCGKPAQTRPGLAWHNSGRRSRGDRRGERCAFVARCARKVDLTPHPFARCRWSSLARLVLASEGGLVEARGDGGGAQGRGGWNRASRHARCGRGGLGGTRRACR